MARVPLIRLAGLYLFFAAWQVWGTEPRDARVRIFAAYGLNRVAFTTKGCSWWLHGNQAYFDNFAVHVFAAAAKFLSALWRNPLYWRMPVQRS